MSDNLLLHAPATSSQECASTLQPHAKPPRIGLFDSGVGGLSVLHALQQKMPWLDYVYCGDTARLPYGKRKPETIRQYSMQASRFLVESGVNAIVIACNTASSVALHTVQHAFPDTLIRGVVEAGAHAALQTTHTGRIAVIGTECTVNSQAYERAIMQLCPTATIHAQACSFLVSLAEEGWTTCDIATSAVKKYLEPLFASYAPHHPDTLVLGCTHFSRFASVIRQVVGPDVTLVDPAHHIAKKLASLSTLNAPSLHTKIGTSTFHATDAVRRFARVGEIFLGTRIPQEAVQRISLDNH